MRFIQRRGKKRPFSTCKEAKIRFSHDEDMYKGVLRIGRGRMTILAGREETPSGECERVWVLIPLGLTVERHIDQVSMIVAEKALEDPSFQDVTVNLDSGAAGLYHTWSANFPDDEEVDCWLRRAKEFICRNLVFFHLFF